MRFKVGRAESDWPEKSVGLGIFLIEFMNKLHLANPMSKAVSKAVISHENDSD